MKTIELQGDTLVQGSHLERFIKEQNHTYSHVISELRQGEKQTHWIWYIFPQVQGLGKSSIAQHFSIKSLEEARAYLRHPILGKRLQECCELVMEIESGTISQAFGFPDDLKLKSSMTLFAYAALTSEESSDSIFDQILQKHFASQPDALSLEIIQEWEVQ